MILCECDGFIKEIYLKTKLELRQIHLLLQKDIPPVVLNFNDGEAFSLFV